MNIETLSQVNADEYADMLINLAKAVDPDGFDLEKVANVVEAVKGYASDPNVVFLVVKENSITKGYATLFVRDIYNHISQIASNAEDYEDVIVQVLRHVLEVYPEKKLYGIVKLAIPQAVKAYEHLGAIRDENSSFEEWTPYRDRKEFVAMRLDKQPLGLT